MISALVGIALARNHIKSVNEPIVTVLPRASPVTPIQRKQKITVEDLLTMRSGLELTSGSNYGEWVRSRNWVKNALNRPMVSEPGHRHGIQHRQQPTCCRQFSPRPRR